MDKKKAEERIIKFSYAIRHHSMRRIVTRRKRTKNHSNIYIMSLIEYAKKDYDEEVILIRKFKERIEDEIGQPLGVVVDADGRQI